MSQTNNLNHNLNMILVLKFDDIKKDIETQWVWGNTEDKDKIFALNLWCKNVAATQKVDEFDGWAVPRSRWDYGWSHERERSWWTAKV